ncbi:hypothetical protein PITCH_A1910053 [uncultured Desulfobacterium sp.]|uniref:Uncharacterized protein n=1 Tax=uncultured Desulfobacterium sp. TaxID=201089 RepID=A0A445MVX5_9BACT|nr:hypothetical protein PITCH_A1910053 [uncultured Desulfobacterium sp.]
MLLQRPRYPEKWPNRQIGPSLKRALSYGPVRIKFQANAAIAWNDLKTCAVKKQTPAPARPHPDFLKTYRLCWKIIKIIELDRRPSFF